ncbi:MAG: hypothetical protein AVDCRST_MAG88-2388 [uncultured Thermomicrobiales bacterium]|uniref:DUF389 domain-containing protein n=1 Tax=uncultured Thermomicrobiales bacterium TaxID=1645740 RepID=A0A6J4VCD7_9BACT|nr:MAG: hypothetical protein AVDCRST_MAG88-2388 [uncultured Thermomicrobiales bacterium]
MHRTIEIAVPPGETDRLLRELGTMDDVVGLSVERGASLKPPGDVVTVHALNRGTDAVLKCAATARRGGSVSIVTAEVASIIDPEHSAAVDNDVDEAVWEEMETGLRHQGRITPNYLLLMATGGAIAAAGLVSEAVPQAIAFVGASVIAPGFEPIVKIPLGLILRRWEVVRRGLVSVGAGYAVLIAAAAAMFLLLRAAGATTVDEFVNNPEVEKIAHPTILEGMLSACAAVAGVVMVAAYRRSVIAGPLIVLVLIPAAAAAGVALVSGQPALLGLALRRLGLDALLIVGLGALVIAVKQATIHRRAPVV